MNYNAIRKRLAAMEAKIAPGSNIVSVELPDGTRAKKSALEYWEHRHEWKLSHWDKQDNGAGLVALLVFAEIFDSGIEKADAEEAERLTKERDEMLNMYFGEYEG